MRISDWSSDVCSADLIRHRLGKVGWTGNPSFSPDAFEEIFDYSEGVPRKLNVLVSRILLYGAVEQMNRITAQNVRSVVAEIEADRGIDASTLAPLPVDRKSTRLNSSH